MPVPSLQIVIDEMRKEAREWLGRDPINRRISRRLEYFASLLETLEPIDKGQE